ncbi:MAG: ATP-binding protein, partial [Ignavibacteria bacterium]|nr:ATP-binding protein [Ignavibacteria bacterium]
DNYLIIRLTDDGCGIEEPDNIFDPFFTTKVSGTGLGLSISQKIIEQHNGKFSLFSSRPGETIFEIKLPLNNYGKDFSN